MAVSGFNRGAHAHAEKRMGVPSGMFMGKMIQDVAAGMKALSEPGREMMNNMMDAIKQAPQKLASKVTKPFVNPDEGFGSTFSKAAAATRKGYGAARAMKPDMVHKSTGPKGMAPT